MLGRPLVFFDFSDDVECAVLEARDEAVCLSARTETAKKLFPNAVKRAGFSLMSAGEAFIPRVTGEQVHVIGVATWSDPDLAALDGLAQNIRNRAMRVVVFDIDAWSLDEILRTFPGAIRFTSTPLLLQYKNGEITFLGEGHDAILWLDQI